ncbi:MAG: DUF4157 domain-containing protein [Actinobacteria bacterium]|nr:DUF4157 domain-containing protein [Actinomycetota bacterium]
MPSRGLNATERAAYDHVPARVRERARIRRVPWLPPGTAAMTLGRTVLVRRDPPTDGSSRLLAHELVHVEQYARSGPVRFLLHYLTSYVRLLARLRSHDAAYRAIPAEVEAYAADADWAARRR